MHFSSNFSRSKYEMFAVVSCLAVAKPYTITLCERSGGQLRCPNTQILDITSANYGRTTGASICPHYKLSTSVTNCTSESALAKVQSKCQNKTSCELFASDSVFGDPCSGVYKYLAVGFSCIGRKFCI